MYLFNTSHVCPLPFLTALDYCNGLQFTPAHSKLSSTAARTKPCLTYSYLWLHPLLPLVEVHTPSIPTSIIYVAVSGYSPVASVWLGDAWGSGGKPVLSPCLSTWYSTHREVKWQSLSPVQFFAIPWTVACEASLSMEFSRQEYWSGLPFPSPGDLPDQGGSPALQADSLPSEPQGKQALNQGCQELADDQTV